MADMDSQLSPNVAIIGGGCAGLAAAVALARAGVKTTLFDSSHQLGGRARGISWQGTALDNGQHILLGAYSKTLELLQTCDVDIDAAIFRQPLRLDIPGQFSLSTKQHLPAPLHLLIGLLQASGLTWSERFAAICWMANLRLKQFRLAADISLQQLLANQPPRLITMLWEPLCLAALNTPVATASAQTFLNVLRDSFAHNKTDSDLLLPRVDLSTLLADPAAKFITAYGGEIKLNSPVDELNNQANRLHVKLKEDTHHFSHAVIATSPFRAARLLQSFPEMQTISTHCEALQYQPICTVYLQYPADIRLPNVMSGLVNQLGQWVFDRGQLYGQAGLLAVVISAEGKHQEQTQATLAMDIHHALQAVFPVLQTVTPRWHKVVTEKRATFACTAGLQRPVQNTGHSRVWLAGDYVSTGDPLQDYPATIEGAVRSGFQAADNIINSL